MEGKINFAEMKTKNIRILLNSNQKTDPEMLFELGIKKLINRQFYSARKYFKKSAKLGHELSKRYCTLLRKEKDASLARDIILCAERRI